MILVLDTCGSEGGVALGRLDAGHATLLGEVAIAGKTYAAELVPVIAKLLDKAGCGLADLDALAVVHGPGSFTGVRIGVGAAKGLVEAAAIPLIAISRLEVLAREASSSTLSGTTIAVFDAGRGEFYAGVYEQGNCIREGLMSGEDIFALAAERPAVVAVCEERAEAALAVLAPRMLAPPMPRDALPIALERWQAGRFEDAVTLDGNYLRRSDAEIFSQAARDAAAAPLRGRRAGNA